MTQKEQVLNHLRHGGISQKVAFEDYGITRLACSIYELRKDGYEIERVYVPFISRLGRHSKYAEYRLKTEDTLCERK